LHWRGSGGAGCPVDLCCPALSFRGRLTLFLLLIVGLPMIVVAVLAARTADDASRGKADARLFAGLETATQIYESEVARAEEVASRIGQAPELAAALRSGEAAAVRRAAASLASSHGAESLAIHSADGETLASAGTGAPFAAALLELEEDGRPAGSLTASVSPPGEFVREVERLTGRRAALYEVGQPAVTLRGGESVEIPEEDGADVVLGERELRMLTGDLPDGEGRRLALFGPRETGAFFVSSPAVAGLVALVFLVALLFVLNLRRQLSGQVATMLDAAKRIGAGDFSHKVPEIGGERDEMAGLAREFNRMSGQLSEQMEQLRAQQVEIDRSVRRIGEAFASGLDRDGLLEIVTDTAVSACNAEYGLIALSGREGAEVHSGVAVEGVEDAVLAAEARASRAGELAEVEHEGAFAVSAPLRRIGDPGHDLGVMTVARKGEPFAAAERDVFLYLIGQASSSIENVALHELVSEQAVTDELTGLANARAFRDAAQKEAARAERFGHPLSLILLDVDDFKKVNDTYGHLQGDEVLRRIGAILRSASRGIDEPARYGGEEFVMALPETDSQGAEELAERVRVRIEAEEIPFHDREGLLRITASIGVATLPDAAGDLQALLAAADVALYGAKRGGKNRVAVAPSRRGNGARGATSPAQDDGATAEGPARPRRS